MTATVRILGGLSFVQRGLRHTLLDHDPDLDILDDPSPGANPAADVTIWLGPADLDDPDLSGLLPTPVTDTPDTTVIVLVPTMAAPEVARLLAARAVPARQDGPIDRLAGLVRACAQREATLPIDVLVELGRSARQSAIPVQLTDEQLHLLTMLAEGLGPDHIAAAIGRHGRTVSRRTVSLFQHIGVNDLAEAVEWAHATGVKSRKVV